MASDFQYNQTVMMSQQTCPFLIDITGTYKEGYTEGYKRNPRHILPEKDFINFNLGIYLKEGKSMKSCPVLVSCCVILLSLLFLSGCEAVDLTDDHGNVAYENGTIFWAALPSPATAYKTNGSFTRDDLTVYFGFARSFLDTILPQPVPFDIVKQLLDGSFDISTQYMELVMFGIGLVVCLVLGILFIVLMPLSGCCLACCRCCGRCGGKREQSYNPQEDCLRMGYTQALLLVAICMGVSAVCVYVTNMKITTSLSAADTSINNNFDDIDAYIDNTIQEFQYLAIDMYDLINRAIQRDIDDIGQTLGGILVPAILNMVDPSINAIIAMDTHVQSINSALDDVNTAVSGLKVEAQSLTDSLNALQSNITSTKLTCAANCDATGTSACASLDETILTMDVDFSDFPDLNSTTQSMQGVLQDNLTALALEGRQTILDITDVITNSTISTRQTVKTTLDDFADQIETMVDDLVNQLTGSFDISSYSSEATSYLATTQDYDLYRFYAAIGLMMPVLILILIYILSVCCGLCGYRKRALPTNRDKCSNCGGCGLLCGVALTFVLSSFLMLFTVIIFLIGGVMEKICESVLDLSVFSDFIDAGGIAGFSLGAMILSNSSINIEVSQTLRQCRSNAAPYNVLHLGSIIPLEDYMDYKTQMGSIDSEFDSIGNSFDLTSINILDSNTQQTLEDFKTSGAATINFTSFQQTLSQNVVAFDVALLTASMSSISSHCNSPNSDEWDFHIASLATIDTAQIASIQQAMSALNASLQILEASVKGIDVAVDNTISAANLTQQQVQTDSVPIILNITRDYMDHILNYVDQYAAQALYLVHNELAACRPLWNIYESMTGLLCYNVVDAINGIWFGIGWALLFFIPSVVLALKLSKYYRRMNACHGYPETYH